MSENWKIQVSPRVGDTLINLRAETPDEAERILAWATANAGTIADTVKAFGGVVNVQQALPGATVQDQSGPSWSQQGSQQSAPAPAAPLAPQPGQKACVHGAMVYREAKPESGKTWKAWFCPTPKGTPGQCAAEFLK